MTALSDFTTSFDFELAVGIEVVVEEAFVVFVVAVDAWVVIEEEGDFSVDLGIFVSVV